MLSAKNVRESFTDNAFIYQVNNSLIFVIFESSRIKKLLKFNKMKKI